MALHGKAPFPGWETGIQMPELMLSGRTASRRFHGTPLPHCWAAPGNPDGTYLQAVPLVAYRTVPRTEFEVGGKRDERRFLDEFAHDFPVLRPSATFKDAGIVFADSRDLDPAFFEGGVRHAGLPRGFRRGEAGLGLHRGRRRREVDDDRRAARRRCRGAPRVEAGERVRTEAGCKMRDTPRHG